MYMSGVGIGMGRRMREERPTRPRVRLYRVLRGGGCLTSQTSARCAVRSSNYLTYGNYDLGFRSVLPSGQ